MLLTLCVCPPSPQDGTVRVWAGSRTPGKALGALRGHTGKVTRVALCGDGTHAASSSEDGTVRVWDVTALSCVKVLEANAGPVLCVAVAGWGARRPCLVASGGSDKAIRVWDLSADIRGPRYPSGSWENGRGDGAEAAAPAAAEEGPGAPPLAPEDQLQAGGEGPGGDKNGERGTDTESPAVGEGGAAAAADGAGEESPAAQGKKGGKRGGGGGGGKNGKKQGGGGRASDTGSDSGKKDPSHGGHGGSLPDQFAGGPGKKTWVDYLKSIEEWNGITGKQPRTIKGHSKGVVHLAFSDDGLKLISGGEEAVVRALCLLRDG